MAPLEEADPVADAEAGPLMRHFRFDGVDETSNTGHPVVTEVGPPEGDLQLGASDASTPCSGGDGRGVSGGDCGGSGGAGSPGTTTREFEDALARRRSRLAACAETYESKPEPSRADASFLNGVSFDGTALKDWLAKFEDPEEDRRPEFFEKGLGQRGLVPKHCPDRSADMARITTELCSLKRKLEEERAERAELERWGRELRAKEEALEAERLRQAELEAARKDYPRPPWLVQLEGTMNVGVVGNSGVGKSLLINRLRGLQAGQQGWAPVGVRETTKLVSMYAFPCDRRVRLWDFPGAGTALFPLESYIARMGLRYLDMVIIVNAVRFTETEVALMQELEAQQVPYLVVRTKVDIDVWNNREDNGLEAKQTLAQILSDLKRNCPRVQPYLVSLRDITSFDFPKLLSDVFPCFQSGDSSDVHAGWDDSAWSMPVVHSAALTSIQGRWHDGSSKYYVQGKEVHIVQENGASGTFTLSESEDGKIWWSSRWWIDEATARKARTTSQLRWVPIDINSFKPFVWVWSD